MKICIIGEEDVGGTKAYKVIDDGVIRVIRRIKQIIRLAKNNELYVCSKCAETHGKRRRDFEKMLLYCAILGAVVILLLVANIIISGAFDILKLVAAFVVAALIMVMAFFKYVPAVEKTAVFVPVSRAGENAPEAAAVPAPRKTRAKRSKKR
jgi:hypothetical protein